MGLRWRIVGGSFGEGHGWPGKVWMWVAGRGTWVRWKEAVERMAGLG